MARDRKRAKQRRDRARRAPAGATVPRARRDEPLPADRGTRADETEDVEESGPLDHLSAEVDLAEAQLALGRTEYADEDAPPTGDEDEIGAPDEIDAPDELDDAADRAAGAREGRSGRGGRGGQPTATDGAPAPRERAPVSANRVIGFLQASWRELQRVQWPDRRQVSQATGVVLAFVIIVGLFLGAADLVFQKLVDAIL